MEKTRTAADVASDLAHAEERYASVVAEKEVALVEGVRKIEAARSEMYRYREELRKMASQ
jgi:hypothetical protein